MAMGDERHCDTEQTSSRRRIDVGHGWSWLVSFRKLRLTAKSRLISVQQNGSGGQFSSNHFARLSLISRPSQILLVPVLQSISKFEASLLATGGKMDPEYKAAKEAHVSLLSGGGIWEINAVTCIAPVSDSKV